MKMRHLNKWVEWYHEDRESYHSIVNHAFIVGIFAGIWIATVIYFFAK